MLVPLAEQSVPRDSAAMLGAVISALHLFALVLGLAGVFLRGRAMREPFTHERRDALFAADNAWGVAAVLWIGTGLYRLLGGLDKPTGFYLSSPAFHAKMTLFLMILALEIWPMITFIRWRIAVQKEQPIDSSRLSTLRALNHAETVVVLVMVLVAAGMARGVGRREVVATSDACAVREIMSAKCLACHSQQAKLGQLDLSGAFASHLGEPSPQFPGELRIVAGEPDKSFLYRKLAGTHGDKGQRMPMTAPLSSAEIERVGKWIRDGAAECR